MTTRSHQDERRWRAVAARDRRFDGDFVFAVSSTRIYCRPSCPSRRPRRDRVSFFAGPEAAEGAGFRACRRCHPRELRARDPRRLLVERVYRALAEAPDERPTLARLGRELGLSQWHVQRTFKQMTGLSPRQYAAAKRLEALKTRLQKGAPVTHAIYDAGYGSASRAYAAAQTHLGMTPAEYRKRGKGLQIEYSIVASPLGRMLVAATERGVSAVYFGETDGGLEAALRREYPGAELREGDNAHTEWMRAVVARVGGEDSRDVPVDIRATAFQWRVFQALGEIPRGETRSYGELARAIGAPGAARAVGRACATNPVAVVIPCHRAVAANGALTGYRWGVARKQKLLASEGAAISAAAPRAKAR
jgi:AraC family transcriptional regulator of adaptative response/methylated-DNA-[protein]-cysteine methyltransferase